MPDSPRPRLYEPPAPPRPCIERWLILISGFLQTEGQPTGFVRLWSELHHTHSGPYSRVELRAWDDDWHDLAELIWRCRPRDNGVDVRIFAYSWGGPSAMKLARELGRRGIRVRAMALCDPVYRDRWRLWRTLFPWPEIRVPTTVGEVAWVRQRRDWPQGHDVVAEDARQTIIHEPRIVDCGHTYMDDSKQFRQMAHVIARMG